MMIFLLKERHLRSLKISIQILKLKLTERNIKVMTNLQVDNLFSVKRKKCFKLQVVQEESA